MSYLFNENKERLFSTLTLTITITEGVRNTTKNKPTASMKRGGGKTRKRRRQSHGLPTAISRQGISPLSRGEKEVQRHSGSPKLGAEKLS